jgi:hypothetical protein
MYIVDRSKYSQSDLQTYSEPYFCCILNCYMHGAERTQMRCLGSLCIDFRNGTGNLGTRDNFMEALLNKNSNNMLGKS